MSAERPKSAIELLERAQAEHRRLTEDEAFEGLDQDTELFFRSGVLDATLWVQRALELLRSETDDGK